MSKHIYNLALENANMIISKIDTLNKTISYRLVDKEGNPISAKIEEDMELQGSMFHMQGRHIPLDLARHIEAILA